MNMLTIWRQPQDTVLDAEIAHELEVSLSDVALPIFDREKQRTVSAREEIEEEIRWHEDDILSAEGRVLQHESAISEEKARIARNKAAITERRQIIAILDRAASDLDALRNGAQPTKSKRRKAKEPAA